LRKLIFGGFFRVVCCLGRWWKEVERELNIRYMRRRKQTFPQVYTGSISFSTSSMMLFLCTMGEAAQHGPHWYTFPHGLNDRSYCPSPSNNQDCGHLKYVPFNLWKNYEPAIIKS
jgi:hypothetical protein